MNNKTKDSQVNYLHIITLNVPDPPDYGGIIDSFYRIRTLHSLGVKIILHCYTYGRNPSTELEALCEKVYYYKRHTGFFYQFHFLPYIVNSRKSSLLLENLLKSDYPILFDGIHTTYLIKNIHLRQRTKVVRAHNIEHQYYRTLAHLEKNVFRKMYCFLEAFRLKFYERVLTYSSSVYTVSPSDQEYFQKKYQNAILIPSFHPFQNILGLPGFGEFILFHGDLSVIENVHISDWLIREIFSKINYTCIIAGKCPPLSMQKLAESYSNIKLEANPSKEKMSNLIQNAHIHLLIALKDNGLKLKLLYSLFSGRHCLVNSVIIKDKALDEICEIANSPEEFIEKIDILMNLPFTDTMIFQRQKRLSLSYFNEPNAQKLISTIYKNPLIQSYVST